MCVCVYSYIVYRISHMKSQSTYLKDIPFYLSTLLLTINQFQCVHVFKWDSLTNRCEDSAKSRHKYKRQLWRFCAATTCLWNVRGAVPFAKASFLTINLLLYNYLPPKKEKKSINTNRKRYFRRLKCLYI